MKRRTKLSEKQETNVEQRAEQRAALEFETADQLLRFDAARVAVPPEVKERVQESAAQLHPPPERPWWRSLFGG